MDNSSAVTLDAWSSNSNEPASSLEQPRHHRSSSYPLRRPHQTVVIADGFHEGLNQNLNGNGNSTVMRRTSLERERVVAPKAWKTSSTVYRIFISVVAVFVLIEIFTYGFVFHLFRHTDLQAESLDIFPRELGTTELATSTSADDLRFVPRNVVERLLLSKGRATVAELRKETRSPVRLPRLALNYLAPFRTVKFCREDQFISRMLFSKTSAPYRSVEKVCPNLVKNSLSLYQFSIARGLQELGYNLEVHTLKDGELRSTWEALGVPVSQLEVNIEDVTSVDWLNYEGVIAFSVQTKAVLNSLAQEPFANIPVVWIITDDSLGRRLGAYEAGAAKGLIKDWRHSFRRADVVVFQDYALPMIYTALDTGNFFVIPGSPEEVWMAEEYMLSHSRESLRAQHGFRSDDFVIAVVGSPFLYQGMWREHALVMRALTRSKKGYYHASHNPRRRFQLLIFGHGNQSSSYGDILQVMAVHLGVENGTVRYVGAGEDVMGMLWSSDVVVYGSFRDEQSFPPILSRAMSLHRLVIAPNRSTFRDQIVDGKTGFLFPVGDVLKLSEAIQRASKDQSVGVIASNGQSKARNMFASIVSLSYGELLESILEFPVEAALPRPLHEAVKGLKSEWCWDTLFPAGAPTWESFQSQMKELMLDINDVGSGTIEMLEHKWMLQYNSSEFQNIRDKIDFPRSVEDWDLVSDFDLDAAIAMEKDLEAEMIEHEQLEDRKVQLQSTWEDVTKMVKKTEVHKDELRERTDGEIQRSGQPLCIYEPYHGEGAWPFLHDENNLYRGVSLTTRGRRPGDDDVDAQARLPGLVSNSYYRNVLCEYGAFFAIAYRIDFLHRHPWIGFQHWRASSKNVALTAAAEDAIIDAVNNRKHGDAVYFWARSDGHADTLHRDTPAEQPEDFWDNCDFINAGKCREAFSASFRRMYGLPANWTNLPPMPADGGSWSALHSWAMPTSSFMELVMFSRVFVDALDSEYHGLESCCFVRFQREGKHCYCRLLEGLVNVWAYHSARRMIYVDPHSGGMQEQHALESRHGKMWIKFFTLSTLKAIDEDFAEVVDDGDRPIGGWLWPLTGEVYSSRIAERERQDRIRAKREKKHKLKEKLLRMRGKSRQKSLGKYIRPPPGIGFLPPFDLPDQVN